MASRTYRIELKIDVDEQRHEQIRLVVTKQARMLLTTATLICKGRKPHVAIQTDDLFEGLTEHELMDGATD